MINSSGGIWVPKEGMPHLIPFLIIFWEIYMPKMKSKSGAKKRFKALGNGKFKRAQAFKRHILTKKTTKNKRNLRGTVMLSHSDTARVKAMLPYA